MSACCDAHVQCKKEAITDSIKRGLKTFGKLLGNCLYDRQYAREVLKMPVPSTPFNRDELHRAQTTAQQAPRAPPKPAEPSGVKRASDALDDRQASEDAATDRTAQAAKQARLRQAEAAKAAHRRKLDEGKAGSACEPVLAKGGAADGAEALWSEDAAFDDAEALSMAVDLELEDEMLLRQSQLAQELESGEDAQDGATRTTPAAGGAAPRAEGRGSASARQARKRA